MCCFISFCLVVGKEYLLLFSLLGRGDTPPEINTTFYYLYTVLYNISIDYLYEYQYFVFKNADDDLSAFSRLLVLISSSWSSISIILIRA